MPTIVQKDPSLRGELGKLGRKDQWAQKLGIWKSLPLCRDNKVSCEVNPVLLSIPPKGGYL